MERENYAREIISEQRELLEHEIGTCNEGTEEHEETEQRLAECISSLEMFDYEPAQSNYDLKNIISTLESQNSWISVKERLPKEYGQYLIYCPTSFPKNCRFLSANYYDDNKLFYCDAYEITHEDVTHWMEIKEPSLT